MLADELKQEFENEYKVWKEKHNEGLIKTTRSQFKQYGHAEAYCHAYISKTSFGSGDFDCKPSDKIYLERWIKENGFRMYWVTNSHGAESIAWKF